VEPVTARLRWLTFCAAFALVAYAPLLSVHYEGLLAAFKYLAADAFYYLAVADHTARAAFFTFDGTHAVNGFHPLWEGYLAFSFGSLRLGSEQQILFAFASSILFTAVGTGLFAVGALAATRSVTLGLLAAVPGFYYWLIPSAIPQYGAQWSFVNGMESPLAVLFFGLTVFLLLHRGWLRHGAPGSRLAALSLVLTLLTLSRLDDVFLFVPFVLYLTLAAPSLRQGAGRALALVALPSVVIGAYLLFNLGYAGAALPLSGAEKAQGPIGGLLRNAYAVLTVLVPLADIRGAGPVIWGSEAWRVLQMVLPALAALLWMALRPPRQWAPPHDASEHQRTILFLLAGYVVLKAAYNFVFVGIWHQGHWYYPVSIMTFNLLAAAGLAEGTTRMIPDRLRFRIGARALALPLRSTAPLACVVFLAISAATFASIKARHDNHRPNFLFWTEREAIQKALDERCPACGILSFDDGIVAYSLASPTMNGLGLQLDKEAVEAKRSGRLLDIARARGFRLLTSLNYPFAADLDAENLRSRLQTYRHLTDEDLSDWHFEIAYRHPATGAVFIAFDRR
jgi:hypothetical protein